MLRELMKTSRRVRVAEAAIANLAMLFVPRPPRRFVGQSAMVSDGRSIRSTFLCAVRVDDKKALRQPTSAVCPLADGCGLPIHSEALSL